MQTGRFEDALPLLQRAAKVHPASDATHNNIGLVLKKLGRPLEALGAFDHALQIAPNAETWNNRGTALNDLNPYEDAIHSFDQALLLEPRHLGVLHNRGKALLLLARASDAAGSRTNRLSGLSGNNRD